VLAYNELIDVKVVKPSHAPNGEYKGTQSGYEVRFVAEGHEYVATSLCGVRGINEPVTVVVNDKGIYLK